MISNNHWLSENYTERIDAKEWRKRLLEDGDKIIFHGRLRRLRAKRLGYGVIEISKEPLKND